MTPVTPVLVRPELDAKPWGSRRLAACGIHLPAGETIGEAHLAAPGAVVISGPLTGTTLGELAHTRPEAWVGELGLAVTGGRAIFPLLVKLIDACTNLSIQVHPDDAAAAAANLGTGKTEAWHVLDARPGSVLFLGLKPDVTEQAFQAACRRGNGSAARCLRQVPAKPGMTVLVPAGTPHAIGAGVLLYEIQQPSNVTFRLDDWGRVDHAGQPRTLHLDAGFSALDASLRPEPAAPLALSTGGPRRELLVATRYFALEHISPAEGERSPFPCLDSPQVLTCLQGGGSLCCPDTALPLGVGETAIIPVGCAASFLADAKTILLRGWVPDPRRDLSAPDEAGALRNRAVAQ